jgi:hypothetical protein
MRISPDVNLAGLIVFHIYRIQLSVNGWRKLHERRFRGHVTFMKAFTLVNIVGLNVCLDNKIVYADQAMQ